MGEQEGSDHNGFQIYEEVDDMFFFSIVKKSIADTDGWNSI